MNTTHGGGIVFFPPASGYHFASGVNVPAGVWLEGAGLSVSSIQVTTDISPITFSISSGTCPSGGHHGGMEKMSVYGYQNAAATSNAVTIGNNCAVTLRDNQIWFGSSGLFNKGVNSYIKTISFAAIAPLSLLMARTGTSETSWILVAYRVHLDSCKALLFPALLRLKSLHPDRFQRLIHLQRQHQ